jgi:hypothetical protein
MHIATQIHPVKRRVKVCMSFIDAQNLRLVHDPAYEKLSRAIARPA